MPKFTMMLGDATIDMTADVKSAKSDHDLKKALTKALKAATKKDKKNV